MKVIDAFSFFNEFEILKLRLNYLKDVVDYFLICEGKYTYSGEEKIYYLEAIKHELPEEILNKIISIHYEPDISQYNFPYKVEQFNPDNDNWKFEKDQRDYISHSLSTFAKNDLFIYSDVDEIPNKELIQHIKSHQVPEDFCASVDQEVFYYNFHTKTDESWKGTIISTVSNAVQYGCDYFRANRYQFRPYQKGGWHFSFFGNENKIKHKIKSFSHQEYNQDRYTQNISNLINSKQDLFHRDIQFNSYNFNDFPKELQDVIISIFPKHYIVK